MRNYSIAGKRGQWPAPEDTSLSYLILSWQTGVALPEKYWADKQ